MDHYDLSILVKAVRSYAHRNYDIDGWGYVLECWDFDEIAEPILDAEAETAEDAIKAVRAVMLRQHERQLEIQACAYL